MRSVLVTGASSGIGRACTDALAASGFSVLAGVRREADAERLRAAHSDSVTPVMIDVTREDSVEAAAREIERRVGEAGLHGLVNNAGVAVPGPVELIDGAGWRTQLETNLIGPMQLTRAMLPALRRARGRIVNMSSQAGRVSFPYMAAYNASKYALEAASDALRLELAPFGVRVVLIEPGRIRTDIFEKADASLDALEAAAGARAEPYRDALVGARNMSREATRRGIGAAKVARAVVRALSVPQPRARYLVGTDARLLVAARWVLPDVVLDAIVTWFFARAIKGHPI